MEKIDILKRIEEALPGLSKGQKLIANYIVEHYEKAAYFTAAKLGSVVGVSESTVVRFANELGYDGYPKLQKTLQELIKIKLTTVQRLQITSDRINEKNILKSVLQLDIEKIRTTLDEMNEEVFCQSVDAIVNAEHIYIIGVRSSSALASFMGFYFNLIFENVKVILTNSLSEMYEQIFRIGQKDVLIGISFPRYSKRTIKAMQYARNNGATVISITDNDQSPLVDYSHYSLFAKSDMLSFIDSLVAPLSLINALIVAVGLQKEEVYATFEKLEAIWDTYQVFDKDHDDIIDYKL